MYVQIFIPYLFEKLNKKFEERERDGCFENHLVALKLISSYWFLQNLNNAHTLCCGVAPFTSGEQDIRFYSQPTM
jgi:hypothetical protein